MTRLTLTIMLFIIVSACFSQSVRPLEQKKFNFFYKQATKCLQTDLDSAYVSAIKASVLTTSRKQDYHINYLLGYICNARKEWRASNLFYKQALVFANPNEANGVRSNIADNLVEMRRYNDALVYTQEIVLRSRKIEDKYICYTYGIIAKSYSGRGELDSSLHYFDKAINLIPSEEDEHGRITTGFLAAKADVLCSFGKLDAAIDLYKRSLMLQQTPYKRCEVQASLAKCFLLKREYKEAQEYLERALELKKVSQRCYMEALQVKLELEYQLRNYKQVKATCQTLGLLANTADLDKQTHVSIMSEIQEKLTAVIETKDQYLGRMTFAFVMLLPLALLVRLLFKFRGAGEKSEALRVSYTENDLKEARLRRISDT